MYLQKKIFINRNNRISIFKFIKSGDYMRQKSQKEINSF